MPIEQTTPPTLTEVQGSALKEVSNGYLNVDITVTPRTGNGWPPTDELNAVLLELFNSAGRLGWVGTLRQRVVTENTLTPDNPSIPPGAGA